VIEQGDRVLVVARARARGRESGVDIDQTVFHVSQHIKVLKDAGLVVDRPAGNRRIYQLDPDGVGALRAQLDRFWSRALAAYKEVVEQREEEIS
jgi:DNA-binding transcriptional ArsR family regulator